MVVQVWLVLAILHLADIISNMPDTYYSCCLLEAFAKFYFTLLHTQGGANRSKLTHLN